MKKYSSEKDWSKVGISNAFMFCTVIRNPDLCKKLLERIFPDMKIDRIEYLETEKSVEDNKDAKGIRVDVYATDDQENVYDIEMQVVLTNELPKRSRYYQSIIDVSLLNKGELYERLKTTYIIFICLKDPFGKGRHQYTFRNICKEDPDVYLGDETTKIFLNACGTKDDVNPELQKFLNYVATGKANDEFSMELEKEVFLARQSKEWRRNYMLMSGWEMDMIIYGEEKGREEGLEEGLEKGLEKGRKSAVYDLIAGMLIKGYTSDQIASFTGIPLDVITETEAKLNEKQHNI